MSQEKLQHIKPIDICVEFFFYYMQKSKGITISRKNFYKSGEEKLKTKHAKFWPYFEELILKLSKHPDVDYRDFIRYVAENSKNFYHPKVLTSFRAFSLYFERYKEIKREKEVQRVYNKILTSINNIAKFCVENNISDFSTFKKQQIDTVNVGSPECLSLLLNKEISHYILVFLDDFPEVIRKWSPDIKIEFGFNKAKIADTVKIAKDGLYNRMKIRKINLQTVVDKRIKELQCQTKKY